MGILGTYDTWSIYVGDKLGLYRAMKDASPMTAGELADQTGINERYAREWLEQQAVGGFLASDHHPDGEQRRYTLPEHVGEVMTDNDSLNFLAPFVRLVTAAGLQMSALIDAYRNGGGVPWRQFGEDMRTGQVEMNRPWFLHAPGVLCP
jgi:hypothetical protein